MFSRVETNHGVEQPAKGILAGPTIPWGPVDLKIIEVFCHCTRQQAPAQMRCQVCNLFQPMTAEKQPNTKHGKITNPAVRKRGLYTQTTITCEVGSRLKAFLQSSSATSNASTSSVIAVPRTASHRP